MARAQGLVVGLALIKFVLLAYHCLCFLYMAFILDGAWSQRIVVFVFASWGWRGLRHHLAWVRLTPDGFGVLMYLRLSQFFRAIFGAIQDLALGQLHVELVADLVFVVSIQNHLVLLGLAVLGWSTPEKIEQTPVGDVFMDIQDHLVIHLGHLGISGCLRWHWHFYRFRRNRVVVEFRCAWRHFAIIVLFAASLWLLTLEVLIYYLLQAFFLCLEPDDLRWEVCFISLVCLWGGLQLLAE